MISFLYRHQRKSQISVECKVKLIRVPQVEQVLAVNIVQGMQLRKTKPVAKVNLYLRNLKSQSAVCNYWFCLDCRHVSVKLYNMLPAGSRVNIPFHCDGCVRVVPKLIELGSLIKNQNDKFTEYDAKIEDIQSSLDTKIEQQVGKSQQAYKEREERKCNIILHDVTEPTGDDKKKEDLENIMDIARSVECEDIEVESFFRLG